MASSTPSTPVAKRSFSLPVPRQDPQIEVLYTLTSARIVAFTTSNSATRPTSSNGSAVEENGRGTLPWISQLETTIAVGMHLVIFGR